MFVSIWNQIWFNLQQLHNWRVLKCFSLLFIKPTLKRFTRTRWAENSLVWNQRPGRIVHKMVPTATCSWLRQFRRYWPCFDRETNMLCQFYLSKTLCFVIQQRWAEGFLDSSQSPGRIFPSIESTATCSSPKQFRGHWLWFNQETNLLCQFYYKANDGIIGHLSMT